MTISDPSNASPEKFPLSPAEQDVIDFFVHGAQMLSLPKSIGEIYGLLFCTDQPMTFDVIVESLQISKGSASQGLKFLRNLNAVKNIHVTGNRKAHYIVEDRLSKLVSGFLRERIEPQLDSSQERMSQLKTHLKTEKLKNNSVLAARIERLQGWNKKARTIFPLLIRMID